MCDTSARRAPKRILEEPALDVDAASTSDLMCSVCNISVNSASGMTAHLNGSKHAKRVKLLEQVIKMLIFLSFFVMC